MVVSLNRGDPNIDPNILESLVWGAPKWYPSLWESPILSKESNVKAHEDKMRNESC